MKKKIKKVKIRKKWGVLKPATRVVQAKRNKELRELAEYEARHYRDFGGEA